MHHCAIDDALHDRGLKKTHPRHRIIELFHEPRLWCARALRKRLHDVGQNTIYRTLRLLIQEGIIVPVAAQDGHTHFARADQPHHDHLACTKCHVTSCLPCPVPKLQSHTLSLSGLCASCAS
ncbi:transcriptional repressor [Candidatus Uhrbacteria bacterium]|nr:transcriptional repressor [Candidatus Uhrbacteria bacterium]